MCDVSVPFHFPSSSICKGKHTHTYSLKLRCVLSWSILGFGELVNTSSVASFTQRTIFFLNIIPKEHLLCILYKKKENKIIHVKVYSEPCM